MKFPSLLNGEKPEKKESKLQNQEIEQREFVTELIKCSDNPTAENIANFYNKFNGKLDTIRKDLESAGIDDEVMASVTKVFERLKLAQEPDSLITKEIVEGLRPRELDFIKHYLKLTANVFLKFLGKAYDTRDYPFKNGLKNDLEGMSKVSTKHRDSLNRAKSGSRLSVA